MQTHGGSVLDASVSVSLTDSVDHVFVVSSTPLTSTIFPHLMGVEYLSKDC